jgi:hypothetical protein
LGCDDKCEGKGALYDEYKVAASVTSIFVSEAVAILRRRQSTRPDVHVPVIPF